MTTELNKGAELIDQARKIYWDFIEQNVKQYNDDEVHTLSKNNRPRIVIEDDDSGVQRLTVSSISPVQVFFTDETEFDIGDIDTDQMRILAEYLQMDIKEKFQSKV